MPSEVPDLGVLPKPTIFFLTFQVKSAFEFHPQQSSQSGCHEHAFWGRAACWEDHWKLVRLLLLLGERLPDGKHFSTSLLSEGLPPCWGFVSTLSKKTKIHQMFERHSDSSEYFSECKQRLKVSELRNATQTVRLWTETNNFFFEKKKTCAKCAKMWGWYFNM